jgi:hypothetical protein
VRWIVVVVSVFVGIAAVVGPGWGVGAGQERPSLTEHPLVGSWQVEVSFEGMGPVTVTNLISFGGDGIVLAASGGQLPTMPAVAGTGLALTEGHGAWIATGERTAEAAFRYLTLDQSGGISSTNTARMAVEVDAGGDAYGGAFTLDLVSPDGNPMGSGRGTLRGERIGVEPGALGATPVAPPAATPVG